jgi:hypothetical protein
VRRAHLPSPPAALQHTEREQYPYYVRRSPRLFALLTQRLFSRPLLRGDRRIQRIFFKSPGLKRSLLDTGSGKRSSLKYRTSMLADSYIRFILAFRRLYCFRKSWITVDHSADRLVNLISLPFVTRAYESDVPVQPPSRL